MYRSRHEEKNCIYHRRHQWHRPWLRQEIRHTERAAKLYQGIKPLTGDDIADVAVYAANAPEHVQIAEVLILATHQASGSVIVRK